MLKQLNKQIPYIVEHDARTKILDDTNNNQASNNSSQD